VLQEGGHGWLHDYSSIRKGRANTPEVCRCIFFLYFKTIDQFSTGIENAEMSYMAIFAKVLRHK
jgi:hypothetical protein